MGLRGKEELGVIHDIPRLYGVPDTKQYTAVVHAAAIDTQLDVTCIELVFKPIQLGEKRHVALVALCLCLFQLSFLRHILGNLANE